MKINIYALGDCEWYAGRSWLSVALFIHDGILSWKELFDQGLKKLTKDEMQNLTWCDPDANGGAGMECSFQTEIEHRIDKGEKFPAFFATTEY